MNRFLIIFFTPLFLFAELNLAELYEEAAKISVEVIATDTSDNSKSWIIHGFFLNSEGYVLTCKSFLKNKENYCVRWRDAKGYLYNQEATLIQEHPTENAAILKIKHLKRKKFPHLPYQFKKIKANSWAFLLITSVSKKENYPILGTVLAVYRIGNTYNAMLGIPAFQGGQGSPVLDVNGSIIGYQTGSYNERNFVSVKPIYCLQNWLHEFLQ